MTGPIVETEQGIAPGVAQTLKIISAAMGGGLTFMAGLVAWSYANSAARVPTPVEVKTINALTVAAMVAALIATIASEIAWRSLLRKSESALSIRVQGAFIVRLACREGAGLLGMTVAYLAALNGVLRAYPAYWVNLAPYVLFLGFLAAHWPSVERLTDAAGEAAGENPSFSKK